MRGSRYLAVSVLLAVAIGLVAGAARALPARRGAPRHPAASSRRPSFASHVRALPDSKRAAPSGPAIPAAGTGNPQIFHAPSFLNLPQSQVGPAAWVESAMDYDSVRKQTVLFGGCTTSTPCATNETWVFDGDFWTKKTPATSPPARYDATLVFDVAHGNAVLFGDIAHGPRRGRPDVCGRLDPARAVRRPRKRRLARRHVALQRRRMDAAVAGGHAGTARALHVRVRPDAVGAAPPGRPRHREHVLRRLLGLGRHELGARRELPHSLVEQRAG